MADYLYDRLADEFAGLIADRVLQPGDRLPSVRRLATHKRLSVSTVLQALRQLEDRGLVEARPQAGFYVRRRMRVPAEPASSARLPRPTFVGVNQLLMQVLHANEQPGVLPLGAAYPAPGLLPSKRMQRMFGQVARSSEDLLAVGSCVRGNDARLTRQIVRRSLDWGGPLEADEIVVTNSCTEALNLCLRAVAEPGDTIALESPTYFVLLQIIESLGMKALEIPTHARTGISLEALELATRDGKVKACLLVPNANNPLGCIMPEDNKRQAAQLLAERGVPLIEDDIYGDLHFEGARPWPIKSYDTGGNVMLCSSFSKTVSPSLRVGFVAAGRHAGRVALLKTLASGVTGAMPQAALAQFIEGGGFDRQLRHARRAYAHQVARMSDAVAEHFPAECLLSRPQGGFVLWVEMPKHVDALELQGLPAFAGRSSMRTWAFSIASRVAADHFRRPGQRANIVELDEAAEPVDPERDVDERMVVDEMNRCVRQVIDSLPDSYRAALILHDLEELTLDQTAEICACTVPTAKIRIHRARQRLREALKNQCDFYRDGDGVFRCERKA